MTDCGRSFPRVMAAIGGITFSGLGMWALAAPAGFFETVALFDPYNEHFVRDIGAFQIGLGATLILAAFLTSDALAAGLVGVGVGAMVHIVSHLVSLDAGGNPVIDIPALSVLGALLIAAGIMRWGQVRPVVRRRRPPAG